VPECLIVGHERAFLGWFYDGDHVVNHAGITPDAVDEYLRTFCGRDGVLGSMGIYRAAFTSIAQTEPLFARGQIPHRIPGLTAGLLGPACAGPPTLSVHAKQVSPRDTGPISHDASLGPDHWRAHEPHAPLRDVTHDPQPCKARWNTWRSGFGILQSPRRPGPADH
jgi:hypothetical protein